VRFSYDLNGLLEVDMVIARTGRKETLVIEQTPGRLTAAQIAASRRALERLKFHPREALPNTTALARADALYVETRGPLREHLGQAIAEFRAVLDQQDPQGIQAARDRLLAIVDQNGFMSFP
jgi:molecular chaperone HscC